MKHIIRLSLIYLLLVVSLVACSNSKLPKGVGQAFFDESVAVVKIIENEIIVKGSISEEDDEKLNKYFSKYYKHPYSTGGKMTEEEKIALKIFNLNFSHTFSISSGSSKNQESINNEVQEQLSEVKKILKLK